MEKQPHEEYRDDLAEKLKEIRNSDIENPEITKAKAQGYLEHAQSTNEYKVNKMLHGSEIYNKIEEEKFETYIEKLISFFDKVKLKVEVFPTDELRDAIKNYVASNENDSRGQQVGHLIKDYYINKYGEGFIPGWEIIQIDRAVEKLGDSDKFSIEFRNKLKKLKKLMDSKLSKIINDNTLIPASVAGGSGGGQDLTCMSEIFKNDSGEPVKGVVIDTPDIFNSLNKVLLYEGVSKPEIQHLDSYFI